MKITIQGNLIDTKADSQLHVVLSGARGPQGPAGEAGASEWGDIGGDIEDQTDLYNALEARVPYTGATQDVNLGEFGAQIGNLEFDTTPTNAPTGAGSVVWNDTDGTLDLKLKGGNVTLQIGQETVARVVNKTGGNLTEAQYRVVRLRTVEEGGAQGQRLAVKLAQADTQANHSDIIGFVTENIDNNEEGFVTTSGLVNGINTTGSLQSETWADGDVLYLSATVAGGVTNVAPVAHPVVVGYVVYAHANNGKIYVKITNGIDELEELHNVRDAAKVTPVNDDALLLRDSADNNLWKRLTWANALSGVKSHIDTFKSVANGYASLDGSGKVPASELPSYVDDVLEVANFAALPVTGETGKIYVTIDNNKSYRWSGSAYIEIAGTPAWGVISGTITNQTDLMSELSRVEVGGKLYLFNNY